MLNEQAVLEHRFLNRFQSFLLILVMSGLLGYLAWVLAGTTFAWMVISFVVGLYWFGPRINYTLMIRLYHCQKVSYQQAPELFNLVSVLSQRAGLPATPELYYMPSQVENAFTIGTREQSAIVLTHGLLETLTMEELAGVLAHEISHVAHDDIRVMGFADLMGRLTRTLSMTGSLLLLINMPLLMYGAVTLPWFPIFVLMFAPLISDLLQLGLSRVREYHADLGAAMLLGTPQPLIAALIRLESLGNPYFGNWRPGKPVPAIPSVLRTHPETRDRLARLRALKMPSDEMVHSPLDWGRQFVDFHRNSERFGVPGAPRWRGTGFWF